MIPFQEMCEFLTCNQRYSWFYFSKSLFNFRVDIEEKKLVHADFLEGDHMRCWYPASKYVGRSMHDDEFRRLLQKAIDNNDFETVKKLRDERKKNVTT